jgi:hypothetical protein
MSLRVVDVPLRLAVGERHRAARVDMSFPPQISAGPDGQSAAAEL